MSTRAFLSPKQRRFVDEYLIDLNASAAALRAGYSPKSSRDIGQQLLAKTHVTTAIAAAQAARAARVHLTQDTVLREIAALSFSNILHYTIDGCGYVALAPDAPPEAIHAVASIKRRTMSRQIGETTETVYDTEIKLWDKPASLRMAGLHLGMFVEKREHTGKDGKALPSLQIILTQDSA
jgi:phage terminase small subunit